MYDVKWLVNRMHVCTTFGEVAQEIAARLPRDVSDEKARKIIRDALDTHQANIDLYYRIQGGWL